MADVTHLAEKAIRACQAIARFSETPNATTRTFLSEPMRDCHAYLRDWMEAVGMEVTVDHVGNLRGFYAGDSEAQRARMRSANHDDEPLTFGGALNTVPVLRDSEERVVIGSHLDTVPNAGAYDGILGVVLGIALIESLGGRRLRFGIEVAGFSEEEGVRFGFPFIGSRTCMGSLHSTLLEKTDAKGVTVAEAIRQFGLDPSRLKEAVFHSKTFAYLELHIEQGPVLESLGRPLAVVDSIVGLTRAYVTFKGKANHAGTTPMHLRHDALLTAAEWIGLVDEQARTTPGLVATVGQISALPGAANVIAGEVCASLDVRHAQDYMRESAVSCLLNAAKDLGDPRGVDVSAEIRLTQLAVPMNGRLIQTALSGCRKAGYEASTMPSGAGHDAMIVAEKIPSVMIFLRSPGGVSHHPEETVLLEDVEACLRAARGFLEELHA